MEKAYEIMRQWDAEAGIPPREPGDYDRDVPGGLTAGDYEEWLARLVAGDEEAILDGRAAWGLPPFV